MKLGGLRRPSPTPQGFDGHVDTCGWQRGSLTPDSTPHREPRSGGPPASPASRSASRASGRQANERKCSSSRGGLPRKGSAGSAPLRIGRSPRLASVSAAWSASSASMTLKSSSTCPARPPAPSQSSAARTATLPLAWRRSSWNAPPWPAPGRAAATSALPTQRTGPSSSLTGDASGSRCRSLVKLVPLQWRPVVPQYVPLAAQHGSLSGHCAGPEPSGDSRKPHRWSGRWRGGVLTCTTVMEQLGAIESTPRRKSVPSKRLLIARTRHGGLRYAPRSRRPQTGRPPANSSVQLQG
mmetsp:Transcript_27607/g.79601  ORF Transcript_27607/g.79601 Transcript_27607/m.79601 type:complete len:296 (+) Transcript_27607:299-1186(+)